MGIAEKMPKMHKLNPIPTPAPRRKVIALDATRARKRR